MKPTLISQKDTAQATSQADSSADERVYASLHWLLRLQHQARGYSFLPKQPVTSLLSGRHASRMRGRGLNFEELRLYHAGDDIRTIDWKVTARTRTAHTRVFTEERDRPAVLLVDQRIGMFYGTRVNMKSVTAAHMAALAAWRVLDAGDRVGAIVFNDHEIAEFRPQRSRNAVMRILGKIVEFNEALRADSDAHPNAGMLNQALEAACRMATHDYLVAVITDFFGSDQKTEQHLLQLRQHNDIIAALVHDPSASHLPNSRDFVVSNGELQVEVGSNRARRKLEEASQGRIADVLRFQSSLRLPVLPISTDEDVGQQLHRLIGQTQAIRGRRRGR